MVERERERASRYPRSERPSSTAIYPPQLPTLRQLPTKRRRCRRCRNRRRNVLPVDSYAWSPPGSKAASFLPAVSSLASVLERVATSQLRSSSHGDTTTPRGATRDGTISPSAPSIRIRLPLPCREGLICINFMNTNRKKINFLLKLFRKKRYVYHLQIYNYQHINYLICIISVHGDGLLKRSLGINDQTVLKLHLVNLSQGCHDKVRSHCDDITWLNTMWYHMWDQMWLVSILHRL